jgi:hypothetical protein
MELERLQVPSCATPFPIYRDLVAQLVAAHASRASTATDPRDPVVAHALAICASYAYADARTCTTMMGRLGLEESACVRIAQRVDSMRIASTAFLAQSRCGRVAVLAYRGTEGDNFNNWLGDSDVDPEAITLRGAPVHVHSGFYRNVRATLWGVLTELRNALNGRSLLDPTREVEHSLEAFYVTGHSLGGAMAVMFALAVIGKEEHRDVAERLRAIYTFGQPMAVLEPLGDVASDVGRKLFRHVLPRDVIPALPPKDWGHFVHFGREHLWRDGAWQQSDVPVAQLTSTRDLSRSMVSLVAPLKPRQSARYTMSQHGPHHYLDALRPTGCVTEFGDRE